jgi:hypothetical protein
MFRRTTSLIFLIYILIGVYVAWVKGYITAPLLQAVANALIAIFLWFLILLGVKIHIS